MFRAVYMGRKWYGLEVDDEISFQEQDNLTEFVQTDDIVIYAASIEQIEELLGVEVQMVV